MPMPATPARPRRRRSVRRLAERAIAQLHYAELLDIEAEIEAGSDMREIVRSRRRDRQLRAEDQAAALALKALRGMVMERLYRAADGHEPWPGPLLLPREVDFGQVNMWRYIWTAVLLGVVLAQNAVDGNPDAAGRPIPEELTFWDARLYAFWHGDADDEQEPPTPVGDWPPVVTPSHASAKAGAA